MNAKQITQLSMPDSDCGNSRVVSDGVELLIEYEYHADQMDWIGSIHFTDVVAYRFRNEMHSQSFCAESYTAVAEIQDSPWLADLVRNEPPGIRSAKSRKHFAVFLSSNGYFEVIADAFDLPASRKGLLGSS